MMYTVKCRTEVEQCMQYYLLAVDCTTNVRQTHLSTMLTQYDDGVMVSWLQMPHRITARSVHTRIYTVR